MSRMETARARFLLRHTVTLVLGGSNPTSGILPNTEGRGDWLLSLAVADYLPRKVDQRN